MTLRNMAITILTGFFVCGAIAEECETQPTSAPKANPEVLSILNDLEAAGEEYKTIRADIDYRVDSLMTGDTEQRTGYVAYRKQTKKQPAKFRVHFDTLHLGGERRVRSRIDHAFDGQWWTVAKHKMKQITRYQVAAPGEKIEPLRLGEGPFPLPFGQKTDDVLEYFKVHVVENDKDEPNNAHHLLLETRLKKRKETAIRKMEMWIDKERNLPVKIVSRDKSHDKTTVVFNDVKTNVELPDDVFEIPRKTGYEVHVKPLKEAKRER